MSKANAARSAFLRRSALSFLTAVVLASPSTSAASEIEVFLSEAEFVRVAPVVGKETFDNIPTGRIVETTTSDPPCVVEASIGGIRFSLITFGEESCFWSASTGLSDGPAPVSAPNYLVSSAIGFPDEPCGEATETIDFGPGRYVKAFGFYFHSAISADFINTHSPDFRGWRMVVTDLNGETTSVRTDGYLGAGPVPPYFGFLSEIGISSIRVESALDCMDAINWGYDDVSRSEILGAELEVSIDIAPFAKPDKPNRILLPPPLQRVDVVILSTNVMAGEHVDFDATQVDPTTLEFGPNGVSAILRYVRVVDWEDDRDEDMFVRFNTFRSGITCGDTDATLTGKTYAGEPFKGTDSIRPHPCR